MSGMADGDGDGDGHDDDEDDDDVDDDDLIKCYDKQWAYLEHKFGIFKIGHPYQAGHIWKTKNMGEVKIANSLPIFLYLALDCCASCLLRPNQYGLSLQHYHFQRNFSSNTETRQSNEE